MSVVIEETSEETPNEPLVSIVVTNFNYSAFLDDCIQSALNQSYQTVEVIVVDDGSIDCSLKIIEKYSLRINILSQPNSGQTSAFNIGYSQSRGSIVIFLDGDDILYRSCVECIVNLWRKNFVKAQYRLDTIDYDGQNLNMPFPYYSRSLANPDEIREQLLSCGSYSWPVSTGNAFSREYLDKVMPLEARFRRAPDGFLNRVAPLYGPILIIPEILAAYRVHGGNVLAQLKPSPGKFTAKVAYEIEREPEFIMAAAAAGYRVREDLLLRNLQHLETRSLSLRLNRRDHPAKADRLAKLVWLGMRAAYRDRSVPLVGKAVWFLWFFGIAALPKRLLTIAVYHFRMQGNRAKLARKILTWLRRP